MPMKAEILKAKFEGVYGGLKAIAELLAGPRPGQAV
jgi:hypothetical protein